MALRNLPKFKDMRGKLARKGSYVDHGVRSKTDIAIHHSLTKTGSAEAYARYHVSQGWPGIGYHFVIEQDGTIKQCHNLGVKSYHVGNSNKFAVGICLTGDFRYSQPTEAQKESLRLLVAELKKELPNFKRIRGHNEFPGYASKQCPVFDYKAVLAQKSTPATPKAPYEQKGIGWVFAKKDTPYLKSVSPAGGSNVAGTMQKNKVHWAYDVVSDGRYEYVAVGGRWVFKHDVDLTYWTGKEPKPSEPNPEPTKSLHRVLVDGKAIGSYAESVNVIDAVKNALESANKINIERVDVK